MASATNLSDIEIIGPVQALPINYLNADTEIYHGGGYLLGYSLRNRDTTTDAVFSFCDGPRDSNCVISAQYLAAKSSKDFFTDACGIPFNSRLLLAFISGTISGCVYVRISVE